MQSRHERYKLERLTNILKNHFPNCGMWAGKYRFNHIFNFILMTEVYQKLEIFCITFTTKNKQNA